MPVDSICGMDVSPKRAIKLCHNNKEYFFCSSHCRDKFLEQEGISISSTCQPQQGMPFFKNKLFIVTAVIILILFLSLFIGFLAPVRTSILMYTRSIWWAVVLGLLLGGVIDYYVPREYISKILSRRSPLTIINAVFLGFIMSACSHGILALSMQLHKKGASGPAVVSFLLASPWANFAITMMLISLFGFKGVCIIIAAVVIAINTGFIYMFLEKRGLVEKNKNIVEVSEHFSILEDIRIRFKAYRFSIAGLSKDLKGIFSGSLSLADMVLWWIVLGIFLASVAGAYIPVHFFHKFMGPTFLGMLVTLGLATVIEVCSEGSSPLAFEIYRQTGALGNSLVFLMAGVATDYTEIGLLWANVGRRTAIWLPVVCLPQVILAGYIVNRIFR